MELWPDKMEEWRTIYTVLSFLKEGGGKCHQAEADLGRSQRTIKATHTQRESWFALPTFVQKSWAASIVSQG